MSTEARSWRILRGGFLFALALLMFLYYWQGFLQTISSQLLTLALMIVVFGLPHGAYDWIRIEERAKSPFRFKWLLGCYALLALSCIILSLLSPGGMITVMVLLGITHFGYEELSERGVRRPKLIDSFLVGFPVLLFPFLRDSEEFRVVFQAVGVDFGEALVSGIYFLLISGIGVIGAGIGYFRACQILPERARVGFVYDSVLLVVSFLFLPIYLSFLLYFCFWHSLRHTIVLVLKKRSVTLGDTLRVRSRLKILFSVCIPVLFGLALFGLLSLKGVSFFSAGAMTLFSILLSLAVPHMLLEMDHIRVG